MHTHNFHHLLPIGIINLFHSSKIFVRSLEAYQKFTFISTNGNKFVIFIKIKLMICRFSVKFIIIYS